MASPPHITTMMAEFGISPLGWDAAGAYAQTGFVNGTSSANDAQFIPFVLREDVTVKRLFMNNGSSVSGNVDMGIYDSSGTRIVSIGSTAQVNTNQIQIFDIADTALLANTLYYLAASSSTGAARVYSRPLASGAMLDSYPRYYVASAHPLPASVTLTTLQTGSTQPLMGLDLRGAP